MAFPVTDEQAALGRQRALAVRQANVDRRRLASEVAYRMVTELDDVAPAALSAAFRAMTRAEDEIDNVEVDGTLDVKRLAETAEILHRISRLASGQSTANVAHASLSDDERRERMRQLAAMARGEAQGPASSTE